MENGWSRIALAGISDLAEIAGDLRARERDRDRCRGGREGVRRDFHGAPVVRSFDATPDKVDAVVVTDLRSARETFDGAAAPFGRDRVLAPKLLGLRPAARAESERNVAMPRWYVVQTQPHSRGKGRCALGAPGIYAYLPRYLKRRRHARRIETVAAPLFPRYLFVAIDMALPALALDPLDHRRRAGSCATARSRRRSPTAWSRRLCGGARTSAALSGWRRGRGLRSANKVRIVDGVFADCLGLFDGM